MVQPEVLEPLAQAVDQVKLEQLVQVERLVRLVLLEVLVLPAQVVSLAVTGLPVRLEQLVSWVQLEPQEVRVHKVLRVTLVLKVQVERLDQLDHVVPPEPMAIPEVMGRTEVTEAPVPQALLGELEPQEQQVLREIPDLQEVPEVRDQRDLLVPRVQADSQAEMDLLEQLEM